MMGKERQAFSTCPHSGEVFSEFDRILRCIFFLKLEEMQCAALEQQKKAATRSS
jgi:hypothetical protein